MRHSLTQAFSTFLRRRHAQGHFGRHPPLATLVKRDTAAAARTPLSDDLLLAARDDPAGAIARLQSNANGLTVAEAARRLQRSGPNEIAHEKPLSAGLHLWRCYANPFNVLLTVLAGLSWFSADAKATTVIAVMVVLSTGIRFVQESRSRDAAEALRGMVRNTSAVMRQQPGTPGPAQALEIAQRDLVPGDLVALSAGDMIPADCRVLTARDLFIGQAAMTGESAPAEKFVDQRSQDASALAQTNLVFMGTNVVSGAATALVVATGARTYFGTLAASITSVDPAPNAFQAGVNSVSWLLIRFALVMVPVVFFINGFTKGDWLQSFLFAVSVAVGLTPEMLPMIVTSTLAKGAVLLSRRKVVVKRLDAIQNFGAMDVLCTDKTGTLTQDRIAVARNTDPFGAASSEVLSLAFLNSYYQTGLKNLLDRAVLEHVEQADELKLEQDYRKIDEIPFDFTRRRMSVVVSQRDEHHLLICKGALEEVLATCTSVRLGPEATAADAPLDATLIAKARTFTHRERPARLPFPWDVRLRARDQSPRGTAMGREQPVPPPDSGRSTWNPRFGVQHHHCALQCTAGPGRRPSSVLAVWVGEPASASSARTGAGLPPRGLGVQPPARSGPRPRRDAGCPPSLVSMQHVLPRLDLLPELKPVRAADCLPVFALPCTCPRQHRVPSMLRMN